MIYTITFNPSLDYIMKLNEFDAGETNRSVSESIFPGGKGFNVSTILERLGYKNTALGFVAGFTGKEIEKQLENYFNKDDLILIRQALDEQSNCDSMQSFDYFVQGIRCGVQLYDEIKEADINQLYGLKYG